MEPDTSEPERWCWFLWTTETLAFWKTLPEVDETGLLPPGLAPPLTGTYTNNNPVTYWEYDTRAAAEHDLCAAWPDDFRPA